MGIIVEQRAIRMPPELFAALEQLAVETNSIARRGPSARKPSLTVMLERIAKGEITIQEKHPWSLPAGLAEQAAQVEQQQREEQRIQQHQQRIQQHTAQKASVQKMPLKMEQLNMLELGAP